ncbi:TetR/AcrR family transcriptional regulator [Brachymonas sp. G13]|uniref:TetR/AcrR family transcriptional regulator n=1 Tax=Brachymonas TaxID=28219 RepID=UPI00169BA0CB|nr:TetR/AcrR family transcriptional regulator [Brachymonas sp. J145]MEE1652943.1 TetR/AcrR family transcriptional regulator [Brachymonas sp. J145]NLX16707.1 TetR/AcrR family transcriptional regulator [Ramlibacter sp.]
MSATTSPSSANAPAGKGRRNLHKGQHTRAVLLDAGLGLASRFGLEGITIGALADIVSMSKSGVFAHFGSREDLQIAIIDEYYQRFEREVFHPALAQPRGLPRLRAMFENWIRRVTEEEVHSGCIFISGAVEYDDREGPVSDALRKAIQTWMAALERAVEQARAEGHLEPGTDAHQMIFEIHGLILSVHYEARFLHKPQAIERIHTSFERVLSFYKTPSGSTPGAS